MKLTNGKRYRFESEKSQTSVNAEILRQIVVKYFLKQRKGKACWNVSKQGENISKANERRGRKGPSKNV